MCVLSVTHVCGAHKQRRPLFTPPPPLFTHVFGTSWLTLTSLVHSQSLDLDEGKVSLSMIEKADDQPVRKGGGKGKKGGPRLEERFSASEMGDADWKESLASFSDTQHTFTNNALIDERK